MKKRLITTLLSFAFVISLYSQKQLNYGDNLMDEIAELGQVNTYTFSANGGDIIWLRMRDVQAVDAHFQLIDSLGLIIAEDYDIGGLAEISNFLIEDTATYWIRAFDHNHNELGEYGFSIHKVNAPAYSNPISCYTNISDEITQHAAINVYHFDGKAGDIISAQMRAKTTHLEPQFHIFNSKGDELFKSKRKGRLAIVNETLSSTDRYTVFVLDRGGNDADLIGFSMLTLNKQDCFQTLRCGNTAQSDFAHLVDRHPFLLNMAAGENGILQMRSPDPSIEISYEIYDETGSIIMDKSGSDKMIDAHIEAEQDQTLLILVFDKHGNDLGPYGVHYESITHNVCAQEILCSQENQFIHEIDAVSHLNTYRIHGMQGEPWSVVVEEMSPSLEPQIRLCDNSGKVILDEFHHKKVSIAGTFSKTGFYYLLVGDRSGNDTGQYSFVSTTQKPVVQLPDTVVLEIAQKCVTLNPESSHNIKSFGWSTGSQAPTLDICPEESLKVELKVEFESGCIDSVSSVLVISKPACDVINFNEFQNGEIPGSTLGFVHIYSHNNDGPNLATIFNSSDPPEGHEYLGTPNEDFDGPGIGTGGSMGEEGENKLVHEKILIIADDAVDANGDGLIDHPVEDFNGGFVFFEFVQDVDLQSISLINIQENGGQVFLYGRDEKMIKKINIKRKGNNSFQSMQIDVESVAKMKIHMVGSGAIDDIAFCLSNESSSTETLVSIENESEKIQEESINKRIQNKESVDGTNQLHKPVESNQTPPRFSIFPNPSDQHFSIHFQNTLDENLEITLFNLVGEELRRVILAPGSDLTTINLNRSIHPAGLYLIELKTSTFRINRKLIVR